jgi:hypothetical protein
MPDLTTGKADIPPFACRQNPISTKYIDMIIHTEKYLYLQFLLVRKIFIIKIRHLCRHLPSAHCLVHHHPKQMCTLFGR